MSLAFFDEEFDFNLWPEAFYALRLVPWANIKLDAPGDPLSCVVAVHDLGETLACRGRFPLFHSPVFICRGAEAYMRRWARAGAGRQKGQGRLEPRCRGARKCVEDVTGNWNSHGGAEGTVCAVVLEL